MSDATHDNSGREYAPVDKIEEGTILEADDGFNCLDKGQRLVVYTNDFNELSVKCAFGQHAICGQLNSTETHYIGFYLCDNPPH